MLSGRTTVRKISKGEGRDSQNIDRRTTEKNIAQDDMESESGCGVTHVGDTMTSDNVAPIEETRLTKVNNEAIANEIEDIPSSSRTEVGSSDVVGSESMEIPSNGNKPDHEVEAARDKAWVILAAMILKQNGREKEWDEIVRLWMRLQRIWEGNEVRENAKTS